MSPVWAHAGPMSLGAQPGTPPRALRAPLLRHVRRHHVDVEPSTAVGHLAEMAGVSRPAVPRGLVAVASVLVLALAACGGSGPSTGGVVEPGTYVGRVCRAVTQWNEDVASAFRMSEERPDDDRSAVLRQDMLDFFDDVQDATEAMVERVDDAGTPEIPDGVGVARELRDALATASDKLDANRASFAAIALSDVQPAASVEGAMTVFSDQVEAVYASVERLDGRSPVLREARETESACNEMRGRD